MEPRRSTTTVDRVLRPHGIPWDRLEKQTSFAFTLAGVLLVGSVVVPLGLSTVTSWAWVAGLFLVGFAVVGIAVGLVGLYPAITDRAPRLATVGVLGGVIAGGAALSLIAMGGIALIGEGTFGMELGKPMGIFAAVILSMAGGLALGFFSVGTAGWRTGSLSRVTSQLLLLGGTLLLMPVADAILRRVFAIEIGMPSWFFLPILGLVILVTLATGYSLRTEA